MEQPQANPLECAPTGGVPEAAADAPVGFPEAEQSAVADTSDSPSSNARPVAGTVGSSALAPGASQDEEQGVALSDGRSSGEPFDRLKSSEGKPVSAPQGTPLVACKVELHPLHPMLAKQGYRTLERPRRTETFGESVPQLSQDKQQPQQPSPSSSSSSSSSSGRTRSGIGSSLQPPHSVSTSSSWVLHPPGASAPFTKRWRLCIYQRVFLVLPSPSLWPSPSRCPPPCFLPCLIIHRETADLHQQLLPLQGFLLSHFTAKPSTAAAAAAAAKQGPDSSPPQSATSGSSAAAAAAAAAAASSSPEAFGSFHLQLDCEALLGTLKITSRRYLVVVLEAEPVAVVHEEETMPENSLQSRLERQQLQQQQHEPQQQQKQRQVVRKLIKLATRVVCLPYLVKTPEGTRGVAEGGVQQQQREGVWGALQETPLQQLGGSLLSAATAEGASLDFLDDDRDLLGLDAGDGSAEGTATPPQQQEQRQQQYWDEQGEGYFGSALAKTWGGMISAASDSLGTGSSWTDTSGGGVASWVQQQTQLLLGPNPLGLLIPDERSSGSYSESMWGSGPTRSTSGGNPLEDLGGSSSNARQGAAAAALAAGAALSRWAILPEFGVTSEGDDASGGEPAADSEGSVNHPHESGRGEGRQRKQHQQQKAAPGDETTCSEADGNRYASAIEKLLSAGFYFSMDIELTRSLQRQSELRLAKCRQTLPGFPDCRWRFSSQKERDETLVREGCWEGFSFAAVADARFSWNSALLADWRHAQIDPRWTVPLIQGYVGYARVERLGVRGSAGNCSRVLGVELLLICRRSCRRGGTRYNARGIDDEGNVANFAESEQRVRLLQLDVPSTVGSSQEDGQWRGKSGSQVQTYSSLYSDTSALPSAETSASATADLLLCKKKCCYGHWASMLQVRGSVPLFWGQSGLTAQTAVTRNALLTANAFERHLQMLHRRYGPEIVFINLLSTTRENERRLTTGLEEQMQVYEQDHEAAAPPVHIHYDFHSQMKAKMYESALGEFVQRVLLSSAASIGFFCCPCEEAGGAAAGRRQHGVFRTNCLDCLDRTNVFQWFFCWFWLTQLLRESRYDSFLLPVKPRNLLTVSSAPLGRGPWLGVGKDGAPSGSLVTLVLGDTGRPDQQQQAPLQRSSGSNNGSSGSAAVAALSSTLGGGEGGGRQQYRQKSTSGLAASYADASQEETCVMRDLIKKMWADQGDSISLQYTGTGSVFSSQIKQGGKSSLSSNIDHALKSIGRFYHNTFEDSFRQECVDLLVGQHRLSGLLTGFEGSGGRERQKMPHSAKHMSKQFLTSRPSNISQRSRVPLRRSAETSPPSRANAGDARTTSGTTCSGGESRDTASVPLRVWIGTWNVAGRDIHEWDNLEDWLTAVNEQADIFVFCVQELVELTGLRVLMSLKDREKESRLDIKTSAGLQGIAWEVPPPPYVESRRNALDRLQLMLRRSSSLCSGDVSLWSTGPYQSTQGSFGTSGDPEEAAPESWQQREHQPQSYSRGNSTSSKVPSYVKVRSVSMVGLWISIYARAELRRLINNVEATTVKVGMKGNAGNKGAVGVRLSLGGVSFCFLNVHLASGHTSSHERLQQMQLVLQQAFQTGPTNYPTALHHDFAFIAGDFNFRLHMSHQQVVETLNSSDIKPLLECDQLHICKKHHIPPFNSLREPPITFRPTYKYKRNSQFYDLKRTPAWCDRVLFGGCLVPPPSSPADCNTPDSPVRCLSYTHHQRYFSSDHKPVSGVFDVFIPYGRLLGKSSSGSRMWPTGSAGAGMSGSRTFGGLSSVPQSLSPEPSTGGVEASSQANETGTDWAPLKNPQLPLPTLADVDLLGGGVAPLLPDPVPYPQTASLEHAQEINLLSLQGSPRDPTSSVSTSQRAERLRVSDAAAVYVMDGGDKLQEAGGRVTERTSSAMDELDALLSNIHVQNQQRAPSADWALLDLSHPQATVLAEEPLDAVHAHGAQSTGMPKKPAELPDLLS